MRPAHVRASSRGVLMMEQDAAPAGRRRTLLLHSGGAGAPLGGTMTPREELADGGLLALPEARRCGYPKGAAPESRRRDEMERRKRGPAPQRRCDGAPRGATPSQGGVTYTA